MPGVYLMLADSTYQDGVAPGAVSGLSSLPVVPLPAVRPSRPPSPPPLSSRRMLALAPLLLLLLPCLGGARAGLPSATDADVKTSSIGTWTLSWPFWEDLTSDVCDEDNGKKCLDGITCYEKIECGSGALFSKNCPEYHVCVHGTCQCQFPFPKACEAYIKNCNVSDLSFKGCDAGLCYTSLVDDEPWTMMESFFIGGIICFFCVAVGLCACRSLITTSSPRRRTSDGAQSVNSMQRWIDERLRDRPPRYDEMVAEETTGRSTAAAVTPAAVPPLHIELEKPPSYDYAMAEHQTSSFYEQIPVGEGPPPPYSALAMALMEDEGMGFSNPCFEGDDTLAPSTLPATSESTLSLTSVSTLESSSSFRSTASSSCSSYLSASSSGPDLPPLLTVSQAVAIQEMMLKEGSQSSPTLPAQTWTSF